MRFYCAQWLLMAFVVLCASDISYGVVGGTVVASSMYPGTGALVIRRSGSVVVVCTATVIAPRILVTAAHCLATFPAQPLDFTLKPSATSTQEFTSISVRRAYVNPEYDLRDRASLHDIALVELEAPLEGLGAERMLQPADAATLLLPGVRLQLVGYGRTHGDGGLRAEKNAAEATITSVGVDEMTIGRPDEPQNCSGDSGGPAFLVGADGARRLVGIVSRSANDTTDCVDGSIQTRVDAYADWIATTLHRIDQNFQRSK